MESVIVKTEEREVDVWTCRDCDFENATLENLESSDWVTCQQCGSIFEVD